MAKIIKFIILLTLLFIVLTVLSNVTVKAVDTGHVVWNNSISDSTPLNTNTKIEIACRAFGCNPDFVKHLAKCESTNRMIWDASGRYYGMFQYVPSTFRAYAYEGFTYLIDNPVQDISLVGDKDNLFLLSMYSEDQQIITTAYSISRGKERAWGCAYNTSLAPRI